MRTDRAVLLRLATSERFEATVRALPRGEALAWRAAARYVAGTTAADAFGQARELGARGIASSLDRFGEQVSDVAVAERVAAEYRELAEADEQAWLSADLSHLGLDVDPHGCAERLAAVAERLGPGRRIQVGAEDHARAERIMACVLEVAGRGLAGRLGATVQANMRRAPQDMERLVDAGVHVRLVKGAYVETPERALPFGEPTDVAYLRLAHRLAGAGAGFSLATARRRPARGAARRPRPAARRATARRAAGGAGGAGRARTSRCGSTSPSARTGFATGCGASPSRRGA